jgi:hypothetical protein
MDYKVVSGALALVCVALAAFAFLGGGAGKVCVNSTIYPSDDLRVYYLYPLRCVNCDLNKPGQCDYCNSYYDARVMDMVSQEVGAPVQFFVSDVVSRPNVFIASKEKVTLGDARTRFNIANTLCSFAGIKKSCDLYGSEMGKMKKCMVAAGLSDKTLTYQTKGSGCATCVKTDELVQQLRTLDYNDTTKYSVQVIDRSGDGKKIMSDCLQAFDDDAYAPQLICPANGKDLTGDFTLGQAREFADKCMEA